MKFEEAGEALVSVERNIELGECNEEENDGMLVVKMTLVVSVSDIGTMKTDVSKEEEKDGELVVKGSL